MEREDGTFYITVADSDSPVSQNGEGQQSSNGTFGKPSSEKGSAITGKEKKNEGSKKTREITVKKGLESDYYTEIISDEVKEGMQVLVPEGDAGSFPMPYDDFMYVDAGPVVGF